MNDGRTVEEYKQSLVANLQRAWKDVRYFNDKLRQERETKADEFRHNHSYKKADLVWLYTKHSTKGLSKKLQHFWHGPFRIIDLPSRVTVKLQTLNNRALKQVVHVSRLKKYEQDAEIPREELDVGDEFDWDKEIVSEEADRELQEELPVREAVPEQLPLDVGATEEEADDEELEVKAIRNVRREKGQVQYLVSWKGYSNKHNSWEPQDNLSCPELLKVFHRRRKTFCEKCGFMAVTEVGLRKHLKDNH